MQLGVIFKAQERLRTVRVVGGGGSSSGNMLSSPGRNVVRRLHYDECIRRCRGDIFQQIRWMAMRPNSSRGKVPLALAGIKEAKSEWWVVDGEIHEVGDNVPPRERFVIPRDNLPNRRRKQMREQFMRRTRLVLKETEHEPWCKKYMEQYQELRENWEKLYWDEGYSKKIAKDHANYESAEEDDLDFSPYRRRRSFVDHRPQDQENVGLKQDESLQQVRQIRDKFEYDRERRMRDKAFAPMNNGNNFNTYRPSSGFEPFDAKKFFPRSQE